ncbi:lipoprotein LpqH [Mycobacterium sp. DL440]|uniref:lipoprotein LpqH n=1 Tax=Mycobacterium sp. DL440 TaxID=2675523 RepID=UPI0014216151|nr:lipoprotein LpqH [Mycobacterium sp. DL440]
MRHIQQRVRRVAAHAVLVGALATSACAAATNVPADAYTARIFINGQQIPTTFTVLCTQQSWLWTIETQPKAPGFAAIIQTGATIEPKVMRLTDLEGFTGGSANVASPANAGVEGTTFHISGTARGSFADRPSRPAEVQYRVEARC